MEVLRTDPSREHEHGVTLVETLVAVLILSFVAVSTIAMFSQGMRLNASGTDYSAITNVAKDKAEELMGLPYIHTDLVAGSNFTEDRSRPDVTITWRVAEHNINQSTADITTMFAGDPMISTEAVADQGNLKVIALTVTSDAVFGIGRRTITVQVMKSRSS